MRTVKAYIYSRVSSLQQVDAFGLDRQISTVLDFLENAKLPAELGYQLDPSNYEVLESDKGLSGYKGHNFTKGSLGQFKRRVEAGEITEGCLLIESVDRFSRKQGYDAIDEFTFLIKRNIDIVEVETGQIYSYKLDHKLSALSTSIERAHQESKRKARISKKSWNRRKEESLATGVALNNNTPDWLSLSQDKKTYEIDAQKVQTITSIFEWYRDGYGVTEIVNRLNSEGNRYNGRGWNTVTVYNKLRDRRLNGYLIGKYKTIPKKDSESTTDTEKRILENIKIKKEANDNAQRIYPVVIDDELFTKIQSMMDRNVSSKKQRSTTTKQRNLFNGLTKCHECGSPMIVQSMSNGGQYLRCYRQRTKDEKCNSKMLRYFESEKVLLGHIKNLNLDEIYSDRKHAQSLDVLKRQLSDVNEKIVLLNDKVKSASDEDELFAIMEFKRKRILEKDELNQKISSLENESEIVRLNYNYDIDKLTDQDNTALRRKANEHIAKVISAIKCQRIDSSYIGAYYLYDITYHRDILKHILITDNSGKLISEITISEKDNERTYLVREEDQTVFKVESNGNAWVIYASRTKTIDDLLYYINTMMVGREPDDFAYQLNEDHIEWID
ncbi:recombinase [Cronobacter malonaticus]|uniref:Recombinase n=1 Tax=Cronobacter malonaticus TaxID=413503 RepID=V5U250_9ENTR|nr:recombinase family protein [Cronobacter malonaticus]AHB70894.1 recombinase [Cronobacter malonaticus]EGT4402224.1 recombinase family protein [Cronobacter malonaticus]EGT4418956.1 recombinase family protein [Cronobacter malonaticus]ELY6330461.1 recombinase family protein [Cronobacter malonaticus]ELY6420534.1 recombinase family protein [Cronobacter malonaticus]